MTESRFVVVLQTQSGERKGTKNMKQITKMKLIAASLVLALAAPASWAGEREDLETIKQTTLNLINMLVDQGVLSREKADALVLQAEKTAVEKVAQQKKADAGVVRVPYVPETVKREMREQIKQEVLAQAKGERWGDPGALPGWLGRISWEGDFRLRAQRDSYPPGNADPLQQDFWNGLAPGTTGNTTEERNRLRLRARLGMQAKVSDSVTAGVRLATGSSTDPVSTNQTLGNTAQKYPVWVDRAYLKLDPYNWLSISGGRIANPWFGTDLVWDKDLNFEGAAATLRPKFSDTYTGFLTMGAFPLQDIAPNVTEKSANKWLYGAQGGLEWKGYSGSSAKVGLALYDYKHVEGIPDTAVGLLDFDSTKPQSRQKGNSWFQTATDSPASYKLASKFREVNLTASVDVATFDPVHVILTGDYVKNIGYDQNEILQRTGLPAPAPQVNGYQTQLTLGYPKIQKRNDWQAFAGYRYLQQDAVLDAFTDSDFHLGGTNAKGYFLGGSYGLDKNTWLSLRWMSSDQVDGPPLAIDTLQVDLNAKF